ncbi:MAG: glycosyltransferase family 2 protein [Micromonosporaceae bacterium]
MPAVSIVMPVLNEERHLEEAVRHVLQQDYPAPVEVVLAVGPSRDRTREVAERLAAADRRVIVVDNPSGKTPAALNAAIAVSHNPVVARVDGHALLPPDYLRVAAETLAETGADNVGGIMAAEGVTPFEQAVATAMTSKAGVGSARFHTGGEAGPAESVYLGVFRRSAIDRVGGYDEAFARAQDWEMNHRIRASGGTVWFQPRMRVSYRPRADVRALGKQYFYYGRWRRAVARQHTGTISARYLAPPLAVAAIALGLVAGVIGLIAGVAGPWPALGWLCAGFAVPGLYLCGVLAVTAAAARGLRPAAVVWLPAVLVTMHMCWGIGFLTSPRGLVPRDGGAATVPARGDDLPEPPAMA